MRKLFTILTCTLMLFSCSGEISQWRGPERDGIYTAENLLEEWPDGGPRLKLKIEDMGRGLSQAVVYKDVIYVTGLKYDTTDVLSAYDLEGELLWDKEFSTAWRSTYPESRGTPTIENDRIYLIGGSGDLVCMSAKDGTILWRQKPLEDYHGEYMHWGIVGSVLLTNDAALFVTGGDETTVVAYHKKTGDFLWKTKSVGGKRSYASSSLVKWGGLNIALIQIDYGLLGVDVDTGEILWTYNTIQYHKEKGKGEAANTPLFHQGEIFITYGNNQPGLMFSLAEDGRSIELKWKNDLLDTHIGGLVYMDGVIYGSDMEHNTMGRWAAVDWETGNTYWEMEWFNKGSVISADGLLYFYEEKTGNVALVQPDTTDLHIISSFKINEGKGPHWVPPSIYKGMLFIRHGNSLMAYNISKEKGN